MNEIKGVTEQELEFLKGIIKHIKGEIKKQNLVVDKALQDYHDFGIFEDCGDSYKETAMYEQGVQKGMVRCKIMLEKYYKKCGHELIFTEE